jgi:hypothetical protein
MVRDVDNHGHKIWRPFSALDASTTPSTSLAVDDGRDRLMLSNARHIEFVLHKNIVNSVRAVFFSKEVAFVLLSSLKVALLVLD